MTFIRQENCSWLFPSLQGKWLAIGGKVASKFPMPFDVEMYKKKKEITNCISDPLIYFIRKKILSLLRLGGQKLAIIFASNF